MSMRKILAILSAALMLCTVTLPVSASCIHTYDHDYDAQCNLCGETRQTAKNIPITFGGTSTSEDVNGLAFKFDVAVSGLAMVKNSYTAVYDDAMLGNYKVIMMGAIAYNGYDTQNVEAKKLYSVSSDTTSFVVRIVNIPLKHLTTTIKMKPYIVIEVEGVQYTIYGKEQADAYQPMNDWTPIG